jgi:hypothetical protein
VEPLLDRLLAGDHVVGDGRTEHGQAPLVDQLAVGVDDRLDRALGQALDLFEDDLDRAVDHPLLQALLEHELEGLGEIGPHVRRKAVRQDEVEQVPQLDGFRAALVAHVPPPDGSMPT